MKFYKGAFVSYTEDISLAGETNGPFIKILPKHKDDLGLLEHELTHVKQWYFWLAVFVVIAVMFFFQFPIVSADAYIFCGTIVCVGALFHNLIYRMIKPYRKWCEVFAYRKQISYYPEDEDLTFAWKGLMLYYRLNITEEESKKLLKIK